MAAFDVWTWATIVVLPFWIFAITAVLGAVVLLSCRGNEWWRVPFYMALFLPIALIGAGVPVGMFARQIDRNIIYNRCVTHENARDPLNGCPEWTRAALIGKEKPDAK